MYVDDSGSNFMLSLTFAMFRILLFNGFIRRCGVFTVEEEVIPKIEHTHVTEFMLSVKSGSKVYI